MKKLFFRIGYAIFLVILITLGSTFLLTLFPVFGVEARIVESGSMAPAIVTGSMVVIVPQDSYEVGDVITYGTRVGSIPTTHRVIGKQAQNGVMLYETRGDANENADPRLVREDQVRGEVVISIPYLGYIIDFARQPLGFAFLIGVPAAAVVIDEIMTIVQESKRLARKRKKKEGDKKTNTNSPEQDSLEQIDEHEHDKTVT